MDVSAVTLSVTATSVWASQGTGQQHRPFRAAMDAAATTLGMAPADLRDALRGGQSLADLATGKGVSQDDLVKAMAGAIGQANPNLAQDAATRIATRIATAVPGQGAAGSGGQQVGAAGGQHHHHHHDGDGSDLLVAVSQVLGESADQVASALQSGQSLTQLAQSKGVSVDDIVKALAGAFQADNPNLSGDQATQLATEFATASSTAAPRLSTIA